MRQRSEQKGALVDAGSIARPHKRHAAPVGLPASSDPEFGFVPVIRPIVTRQAACPVAR